MYLRLKDYDRFIQQDNLNQIISQDSSVRILAEKVAIEEACSYLRSKYDISAEFTDTNTFSISAHYSFEDRVELDGYSYYNALNSYNINDIVKYLNGVFICINNTTGTFDVNDWLLLGQISDLFYIMPPEPYFNYSHGVYKVGDVVAYNRKVYTALKPSPIPTHVDLLNALTYNNVPPTNILPDDPTLGAIYWGVGVPYDVNMIVPTDNTIWALGDNRSQQLVMVIIDITLYHIHSRIAPRNIPELRVIRYQAAIDWLKMCNSGDVSPDIPLIPIQKFNRIRWGGNTKTTNIY